MRNGLLDASRLRRQPIRINCDLSHRIITQLAELGGVRMATMLAHIKIKAGSETAYEDIQSWLYQQTHAHEPSIGRYEFFRGQTPGEYYGLLSFDDFNGFIQHQCSDYHETFVGQFGALVDSSTFTWIDPLPNASTLAPTKAQPLPENASETARKYEAMLGVQEPTWWRELSGENDS